MSNRVKYLKGVKNARQKKQLTEMTFGELMDECDKILMRFEHGDLCFDECEELQKELDKRYALGQYKDESEMPVYEERAVNGK